MMTFKERLQGTDRLTAHIVNIPSATVTQAIAAAGADAVIVDFEHGAIDHASAHAMIAATAGTNCAPLVRVAENDTAQVKRVLDLGAEGVVFPLIRSAEEAQRAVASLHYPPNGNRGFGPFMAHARWGIPLMDYREAVDDKVVCCLLIETRDAVENIDAICAVPGIDLIIPATFDLSTDLGVSGQFDHPDLHAALTKIEDATSAANIPLGAVCLAEAQAQTLIAKGYRVFCGFDLIWMGAKAAEVQEWISTSD
ncbi:MAG: aldolase/citrate lyase family protein [Paracoccaceae bacterium]